MKIFRGRVDVSTIRGVKANRNFDQLKNGQVVIVDVDDDYWRNQISAGNVTVVEDSEQPSVSDEAEEELESAEEEFAVVVDQELSELLADALEEVELEEDVIPEPDPED